MKKYVFLLLFLIGYGPFSFSQKLPPILQKLADCEKDVITFQLNPISIYDLKGLPLNYKIAGQNFIKSKDGLFLLPQGTGRIYRLDTAKNTFKWTRIDSTFYYGYNFGFISFRFDSTIYSYGGDGFWNTNGNLRIYNSKSHEWNAVALSDYIYRSFESLVENFHYIDSSRHKMYIKTSPYRHDVSLKNNKDSIYGNRIYCLDVDNGNWEYKGKSYIYSSVVAQLPWGVLSDFTNVFDPINNKTYVLNERQKQNMLAIIGNSTKDNERTLSYCIDSTLYFGNYNERIDSITISRSDLIDTGQPFYQPDEKNTLTIPSPKAEWIIIVVLSMLTSFLFWKYRKQKMAPTTRPMDLSNMTPSLPGVDPIGEYNHFRSSKIIHLLDEREKLLLKLLFDHSADERFTSIDEINRVIGVTNRSTEIQKRLRSDIITSVNSKMSILHNEKKPIIDKQRSDFDKRSFEYFIQPVHMELVEKVLGVRG